LEQNKEYGTFLSIKETLKKGIQDTKDIKRRSELKIKISDTLELIEAGIEPDFEAEITLNAHKLSEEKKSYEELSRILAKLQLEIMEGKKKVQESEIKKKADEILKSSSTSNELCWLIAELRLLKQKKIRD
jgi:phosphatidate phosphatase PAH1